jgi:hypothetical protein
MFGRISTNAPKSATLDGALVDRADLGLRGEALDDVERLLDGVGVGRGHVDRAVVLDVDLATPVWSTMPLMVLPPGPMMRRIWSGLTLIVVMRGAYFERSARGAAGSLEHLAEDVQAAVARLLERVAQDLRERPSILMSIWIAVMPLAGAADLEVHVAEVVLVAEDVGEDRVASPSLMRPIAMPATGP